MSASESYNSHRFRSNRTFWNQRKPFDTFLNINKIWQKELERINKSNTPNIHTTSNMSSDIKTVDTSSGKMLSGTVTLGSELIPPSSFVKQAPGIISKTEYKRIVCQRRYEFLMKHFGNDLEPQFAMLRQSADKMKLCHQEIKLSLPEHYDVNMIETMLTEFCHDMGYDVVPDGRKSNDTQTIIITLT